MNDRLGYMAAYNRQKTLSPLHSEEIKSIERKSANFSKMENKIKLLNEENGKLKSELNEMSAIIKQLTGESSHEKFDERRINIIKLQIIQLERQVAMLFEALSSRQEATCEVENIVACSTNKLRSYIATETGGSLTTVARSDLINMVESLESARIKLYKAIEGSSKESVGKDLLFLNPFLEGKFKDGEPLTVLDICLHRFNYINLRLVSQLESKMCTLYKDLICVHEQLSGVKLDSLLSGNTSSVEKSRLETMILKSCVVLKNVADDLSSLSLLCPSSPWPELKRPVTKQVPIERLKASLPPLPHTKHEEISHIMESVIRTYNHRQHLMKKEKQMYKEELHFHHSVSDLQIKYTQTLFDAIRSAYEEFENSARHIIGEPTKNIVDAYKKLKTSASEDALREFLIIFKENEENLSLAVEKLNGKSDNNTGVKVVSEFGEEFFSKVNSLVKQCQCSRDLAMKKKKEIKEEQSRLERELQQSLEELESKYEKQWCPKSNTKQSQSQCSTVDEINSPHVHSRKTSHKSSTLDRSDVLENKSNQREWKDEYLVSKPDSLVFNNPSNTSNRSANLDNYQDVISCEKTDIQEHRGRSFSGEAHTFDLKHANEEQKETVPKFKSRTGTHTISSTTHRKPCVAQKSLRLKRSESKPDENNFKF